MAGSEFSDFKVLDVSLINHGRHQHDKLDTFNTPSRNSRLSEDATASIAGTPEGVHDVPNVDRGFLYSLQEKILTSLRLEVQEEASRLRQFFKRAFKEAKDELLMDMSAMQQGPAAVASKILGAVWEVLEEVKESKDKLNMSDILETIREHRRSEVDLSEVLASMDEIKRRLDLVRIVGPLDQSKLNSDLSEVLSEVKLLRTRADSHQDSFAEILTAVKDRRTEADCSDLIAAIAERGDEVSAAIREAREGRAEVLEEVQRLRTSTDMSPLIRAVDEVKEAQAKTPAAAAEAAVAATAGVQAAMRSLREELLRASKAEGEELRQAIQGLSSASSADLSAVVGAMMEEKESILEAIGGLREVASSDHGAAPLLDALREESTKLAASRFKLAEVLALQEERRIESEQDIRQGLEAVRDLRKTVVLDLRPVLEGLDHSEVKMARISEQLMTKLEQQHIEACALMQHLCAAGPGNRPGSARRPR